MGNRVMVAALAIRTFFLKMTSGHVIRLNDCLFVHFAVRNIVSISCLYKDNYEFYFRNKICKIYHENKYVAQGTLDNDLYVLNMKENNEHVVKVNTIIHKCEREEISPKFKWHLRLGHIGEDRATKLTLDGLISSFGLEPYPTCKSCLQGKMTRATFDGQNARVVDLLEIIHMNVYGPFNEMARGG